MGGIGVQGLGWNSGRGSDTHQTPHADVYLQGNYPLRRFDLNQLPLTDSDGDHDGVGNHSKSASPASFGGNLFEEIHDVMGQGSDTEVEFDSFHESGRGAARGVRRGVGRAIGMEPAARGVGRGIGRAHGVVVDNSSMQRQGKGRAALTQPLGAATATIKDGVSISISHIRGRGRGQGRGRSRGRIRAPASGRGRGAQRGKRIAHESSSDTIQDLLVEDLRRTPPGWLPPAVQLATRSPHSLRCPHGDMHNVVDGMQDSSVPGAGTSGIAASSLTNFLPTSALGHHRRRQQRSRLG